MSDHIEHPCHFCGSLLTRDGICGPCRANLCDFCGVLRGEHSVGDVWVCDPCFKTDDVFRADRERASSVAPSKPDDASTSDSSRDTPREMGAP